MNILQLTPRVPWPANDGGSQAMLQLAQALRKAGNSLTIAALNTPKHYANPQQLAQINPAFATEIDTRIRPTAALENLLFSNLPYNVARFWSEKHADALHNHLKSNDYDLILLEGVYLALYIDALRSTSRAPIVLRAHNVEYAIWQRYADAESVGPKRLYFNHLAKRGRLFEALNLPRFDGIAALTATDAAHFRELGYNGPIDVLPPGIDLPETAVTAPPDPQSLCFLGSLEWLPNLQGLRWFLDEIWPVILRQRPELVFHIAGKNPPPELSQKLPTGVVMHGPVPDAREFLERYGLVVVPLLSGSGIRMKILEAMALGKTVLTTPIGAEGIAAPEGVALFRADQPADFAQTALQLLSEPEKMAQVGTLARRWIQVNVGWSNLLPRYESFFRSVGA